MKKLLFIFLLFCQAFTLFADSPEQLHKKARDFYTEKKYTKAVEYWNMAATAGYADAYAFLAMCSKHGHGVPKDVQKRKSFLEQGAEKGSVMCMNDLGSFYYNVSDYQNKDKAFYYFKMAALQNNETAQRNLGLCYKNGHGVAQDFQMASLWFRVADVNGDKSAMRGYTELVSKGYKVSREEAIAFIENNYEMPDTGKTPVIKPSSIHKSEAYFFLHFPEVSVYGDRSFLSINGEEVSINDKYTKVAIEPGRNLNITFGYRNKNGIVKHSYHAFDSVKPGETLYYYYSDMWVNFRPMNESEIQKAKTRVPACKSLVHKEPSAYYAQSKSNEQPISQINKNISNTSNQTPQTPKSDVDITIPITGKNVENSFAVIIANENYSSVSKVEYAKNDGAVFSQYCEKTLGIPKNHIVYKEDATFGNMEAAISKIESIGSAYEGDLKIIFYYAGHGIPDEKTRDSYLIPVDGDGSMKNTCIRTSSLYKRLADIKAKSVIVFMDACFSGSVRGDGMLASARGVKIAPKEDKFGGKMVVFTASHGDETAYPYAEQGHGLFTYFLLKKLQSTSGNVTLGDIADFVTSSVKKESIVNCDHIQTPTVLSSDAATDWRNWNLMKY